MSIAASTEGPADIASSSHEYASRFAGEIGQYFLEVQEKAVADVVSTDKKIADVLEVGGGHCQLTNFYLKRGCKVTIQGSTYQSLQRARDLGFEQLVTLNVSPLLPLEFEDNSFDLVSGIRLMAHVPDWKEFLKEMIRVSKKGIVFDFANFHTLNFFTPLLYKFKKKIETNTRPYNCQSLGEIKNHLEQLGCSQITISPQFVCPMALHRALKSKQASRIIEAVFRAFKLNKLFGTPVIVFASKD